MRPLAPSTTPHEPDRSAHTGKLGTLSRLGDRLLINHVLPYCIEDQFLPGLSQTSRQARDLSFRFSLARMAMGGRSAETLGAKVAPQSEAFWRQTRQAQQFAARFVKPAPDFKSGAALWAKRESLDADAKVDEALDRIVRAWETKATKLDLSRLNLNTLFEDLGALTSLENLDVSGNKLTALPQSITSLEHLVELDASANTLRALPTSLYKLGRLEQLFVFDNALTSLGHKFDLLPRLRILNAHHNHIAFLPSQLAKMTSLTQVMLSHNGLRALPQGMAHMTALEGLWLAHNELTDIEEALAFLPKLRFLAFEGNELPATQTALHRFVKDRAPAPYVPPAGGLTRSRPWFDWVLF